MMMAHTAGDVNMDNQGVSNCGGYVNIISQNREREILSPPPPETRIKTSALAVPTSCLGGYKCTFFNRVRACRERELGSEAGPTSCLGGGK